MKNQKNTLLEEIKIENEILRMQLAAEYGMEFPQHTSEKLSPFIEREWLKSIQRFEQSFASQTMQNCYKLLGEPAYLPAEALTDEQLGVELRKLISLLAEKNIIVDAISDISEREVYSFITKKLFAEDILVFPDNHVVTHFTYGEFGEE